MEPMKFLNNEVEFVDFKIIFSTFLIVVFTFGFLNKASSQDSSPTFIQGTDTVIVYKNVPGYDIVPARKSKSDKYAIKVRSVATNNEWVDVFTHNTYNRASEPLFNNPPSLKFGGQANYHYQTYIADWSHAYGNIEMSRNTSVEIEISFVNGFTIKGQPIFKAAAHPFQKVSSQPIISNGKVYFTINNPAQITIDINGQMDDHHAAINPMPKVNGKAVPLHTISFYANPVMKKPSITDANILLVEPGVKPSSDIGNKTIMYFKPGIHDLGLNFKIFPNKSYYIPGDAVVIATLNNVISLPQGSMVIGENIKIFGYGTISNWGIGHPDDVVNKPANYIDNLHAPIFITDAMNVEVNGIAVSDPNFHSIKLQSWNGRPDIKSVETICRWIKIATWRTNADGIGSAELVEDSFLRTTDDASYIKGDRLRIVFWRDTKAAAFHMAGIPTVNDSAPLRIEDCDVIYNRTRDVIFDDNGGIFQQRAGGNPGEQIIDLKIRNIRNHDKLSNSPVISLKSILLNNPIEYGSSYKGILFENINIEANTAIASPQFPGQTVVKQALIGHAGAKWDGGITFDNVYFKNVLLTAENFNNYFDFGQGLSYPNEFVKNIFFKNSVNYNLSLNENTNGKITSNPGITKFTAGTDIILTAIPKPGYEFLSWSGDFSGNTNPLSFKINSNVSVKAIFQKATTFIFETQSIGTWTVPAGVTNITIRAWGGGGAGGSAYSGNATQNTQVRAGGGAGGNFASATINVTPGQIINYTIGAGGKGLNSGFSHQSKSGSGGSTTASLNNVTLLLANGGLGGESVSITNSIYNGVGGLSQKNGNIGDAIFFGGNGGTADTGSGGGGGSAGSSGNGGSGGVITGGIAGLSGGGEGGRGTNANATLPLMGNSPGGGGAGAAVRNGSPFPENNVYKSGASGANGKLIITTNLSTNMKKDSLNNITLYPNPATDKLFINLNNKTINDIYITDANGKLIFHSNSFKNNDSVNVAEYATGIYVVKVFAGNAIYTSKIIID